TTGSWPDRVTTTSSASSITLSSSAARFCRSGAIRRVGSNGMVEECPYPGLAAFTTEQARWFFGRDMLTADLTSRLAECLHTGGPLIVAAPPGAGKSSLLRAGLLPAISRGALPAVGSKDWPRLVFTPTAHPMMAMMHHFAELLDVELDKDKVDATVADANWL